MYSPLPYPLPYFTPLYPISLLKSSLSPAFNSIAAPLVSPRSSSAQIELKSESSSCIPTFYQEDRCWSDLAWLTLVRYSSKVMCCSSVSSQMESTKVYAFLDFMFLRKSFSALQICGSASASSWFLMIWAEVMPRMLVYSFQVLKIDSRSWILVLSYFSLNSSSFLFSSISFIFQANLYFSLASSLLSCSVECYLLALMRSNSIRCCCKSSFSLLRLNSAILALRVRQRGIMNLFFSRMTSSLLVSLWTWYRSPNSQASASAKSLQQYYEEATCSGKMVCWLSRVSAFSELNQQCSLQCCMILRMRLRLILRTSSSWRCLLSLALNYSSFSFHLERFYCSLQASVKICLRKAHSFQKCILRMAYLCYQRYLSSICSWQAIDSRWMRLRVQRSLF